MGVTIYFEGSLKSKDAYQQLIIIAEEFALDKSWPTVQFEEENKLLERTDGDEYWNYQGPTRGIVIQPEDTEPINFEFDKQLYIQDFCKTQFASSTIHIQIIELLERVSPFFAELDVVDEGEYWETKDAELLQQNLYSCLKAIEAAKGKDASLDGPFKLKNGRIVDLMHV